MTKRQSLTTLTAALLLAVASWQMFGTQLAAAPDFSRPDAKGAAVQLSDYKGKVVLLDFWATYCGGCKVEIPWFVEFAETYKDPGFAVIGVAMDEEGWEVVRPFLDANKVNYAVVLGNEELAALYEVSAMPKTLLIDREGRIAASHVGLVDKAEFEKQIQALLR